MTEFPSIGRFFKPAQSANDCAGLRLFQERRAVSGRIENPAYEPRLSAGQVRRCFRFRRRALLLAGRRPWLAFFKARCGLVIQKLLPNKNKWQMGGKRLILAANNPHR